VRPTASPRSEPCLIANPRRREYQVVIRARRATIRRRSLRATAGMPPMQWPKGVHRAPPRRSLPGDRLRRPGAVSKGGWCRLVRGASSRNKPSAASFGWPIKAEAAFFRVPVAYDSHALPFGHRANQLRKNDRPYHIVVTGLPCASNLSTAPMPIGTRALPFGRRRECSYANRIEWPPKGTPSAAGKRRYWSAS
jgi:hypothetical protein